MLLPTGSGSKIILVSLVAPASLVRWIVFSTWYSANLRFTVCLEVEHEHGHWFSSLLKREQFELSFRVTTFVSFCVMCFAPENLEQEWQSQTLISIFESMSQVKPSCGQNRERQTVLISTPNDPKTNVSICSTEWHRPSPNVWQQIQVGLSQLPGCQHPHAVVSDVACRGTRSTLCFPSCRFHIDLASKPEIWPPTSYAKSFVGSLEKSDHIAQQIDDNLFSRNFTDHCLIQTLHWRRNHRFKSWFPALPKSDSNSVDSLFIFTSSCRSRNLSPNDKGDISVITVLVFLLHRARKIVRKFRS